MKTENIPMQFHCHEHTKEISKNIINSVYIFHARKAKQHVHLFVSTKQHIQVLNFAIN